MRTIRSSIFCLTDELYSWMCYTCKKHDLSILLFETLEQGHNVDPNCFQGDSQYERIFLFPKGELPPNFSFKTIRPIECNWIDIQPGGLAHYEHKDIILMSEVCLQGEKEESITWKAMTCFKQQVRAHSQAGVVGRNMQNGGESVYKDIWHTKAAREEYHKGADWKQSPEFNVVFCPKLA